MAGPATRALGYISDVIKQAGSGAQRDLLLGATPMAVLAGIANRFQFAPKRARGALAIVSSIALFAAIAAVITVVVLT